MSTIKPEFVFPNWVHMWENENEQFVGILYRTKGVAVGGLLQRIVKSI